ncbi:hypothetical protein [Candidatus Nitronereus thalassa]|uniref:DUF4412 domain-containing protein n=1 Tax=Candidatus Nitronereus thalassa TaxID=3020898 RepID=A0ABU3KDA9_9BACT|nr:hypothetical protein [Candidatus Nitronereus thalassa]MDT7044184.1 hypothetical protein [Candidatus Nitronereus thalassa]
MKCPNLSLKNIRRRCFLLGSLGLALGVLYPPVVQALPDKSPVVSQDSNSEFSARLIWRIGKRSSKALLFVKGDRYRIEHLGGIKTDLGYATVTIVRLDEQKVWYILSQRRLVVSVPLTPDDVLPMSIKLEGEVARTRIGDALVGEQPATLYEVEVQRNDHRETYYEWVDESRQLLLKLVSQEREWSVEYKRVTQSKQPDYFFEPPLGYKIFETTEIQAEEG